MISTRSAGLVIDTVVCLTLAKWETVSGRFGGYLGNPLGIFWAKIFSRYLSVYKERYRPGGVHPQPLGVAEGEGSLATRIEPVQHAPPAMGGIEISLIPSAFRRTPAYSPRLC